MAVKLSETAFDQAKKLIEEGKESAADEASSWD
jgi:hypothetical protein